MYRKLLLPLSIIALLALHVPFMQADPEHLLSWHSRGAFTDEGLYTAQVRNLVNHGQLGINQSDGFAKAPLFQLFLVPYLYIGGTHLWLARLVVLLFFAFTLYTLVKTYWPQPYQAWAVGIVGLQYLVFHYSHYALAEMLAVSFILWALNSYLRYINTQQLAWLIASTTALVAAFLTKTNHLYTLAILPALLGLNSIAALLNKERTKALQQLKGLGITVGIYSLSGVLLYLLYFLPNQALYHKIFNQEVAQKFEPTLQQLWERVLFNLGEIDKAPMLQYYLLASAALVLMMLIQGKTERPILLAAFSFAAIWFIAELHKLPVLHLPSRYLVPTFAACALLIASALPLLNKPLLKWAGLGIAALLITCNLYYWLQARQTRAYALHGLNLYMAQTVNADDYVLGSWAPAVCWDSKATTMPVWENYFNDRGFMETYQPKAIITEVNEADAEQVYTKRGLSLATQSDSVRQFTIGEWPVLVYWVKN